MRYLFAGACLLSLCAVAIATRSTKSASSARHAHVQGPNLDAMSNDEVIRWEERVRPTPKGRFPKVGTCYTARIKWIGARLGDDPKGDSGSAVLFDNGLYQVDYSPIREIVRSRVGDPVTLCVVELPKDCPPGDFRGITYRTHNWRTHKSWTLADSEHMCGGA